MEILSRILESAACGRDFLERNLTRWVWKVDGCRLHTATTRVEKNKRQCRVFFNSESLVHAESRAFPYYGRRRYDSMCVYIWRWYAVLHSFWLRKYVKMKGGKDIYIS